MTRDRVAPPQRFAAPAFREKTDTSEYDNPDGVEEYYDEMDYGPYANVPGPRIPDGLRRPHMPFSRNNRHDHQQGYSAPSITPHPASNSKRAGAGRFMDRYSPSVVYRRRAYGRYGDEDDDDILEILLRRTEMQMYIIAAIAILFIVLYVNKKP